MEGDFGCERLASESLWSNVWHPSRKAYAVAAGYLYPGGLNPVWAHRHLVSFTYLFGRLPVLIDGHADA